MCQDPVAARGQDDWSGVGWGECRRQRLTGCVCVCVCVCVLGMEMHYSGKQTMYIVC